MIAIALFIGTFSLIVAAWAWHELRQDTRRQIEADNREMLISALHQEYGVPLMTPEQIRELHAARWDGD